ncbi:MAG: fused acetyl/propionyl-CoA carboxylase subunit alpha/methylmalonyl-CoA decarboxylase subunit alpha, partial [Actinomycetota bacterium]|nr:fused acetyl/propionyl-CoA carboxylase subunit alpha/methylmalonyl-CoA decarboxylase subunit alpha [Actinomycetota bacterium]
DDVRPPDATGTPYLDLATLERALTAARADAAWVGWGFVAERPEFAELCDRLGVVFIGPSADVMRSLGDKIGAKLLAEQAEVAVAPWSGGAVDTIAEARVQAERIGYPLMIKATAGGGGRGIRRVDHVDQLAEAFDSARSEGAKAFGDPTVFMERVVTDARHVEVQLIADNHGTVWAVGVRDCSMQRRNQKVIEESHCIALTADEDRELRASAVRLAALAGYTNAGTVEFLYQPKQGTFAFLEVNTRLQVEHPVTELTTGLDLVKLQLRVAAGGRLVGDPPPTAGYAVEARLNAEDPQREFAPAPGIIETMLLPVGPGVRVDTGVAEGDVIPPEYDSMIAKVIAHGRDRNEALARLRRALGQMVVIIEGGTTNKSFLLDLLERPDVRAGNIDTGWIDRLTGAGAHMPVRHGEVGLIAAALDAAEQLNALERSRFLGWASRGRPHVDTTLGREVELRHGAVSYRLLVRQLGAHDYAVRLGADEVDVTFERLGQARARVSIKGRTYRVVSSTHGSEHLVEIDGVAHRFSRDDAGVVRAPAAALVVGVDVQPGDLVEAGARLAVVEAMKMEIAINTPIGGRVGDVFVARNVQVDAGAPLVRIEAVSGDAADAPTAAAMSLAAIEAAPEHAGSARDAVRDLVAFVLGYDVSVAAAKVAIAGINRQKQGADGDLAVFRAFADVCSLSPERRDPDGNELTGPREYFNHYLRSLDIEREGIPEWFADRLQRALAHYDVDDLTPDSQLQEALMRIFIAQQRRTDQVAVVMALLEDRLAGRVGASDEPPGLRDALDRLVESTQRRHPAIAGMARGVRHRSFDRPLIDDHRADVSAEMREHVLALVGDDASEDPELMTTLVGCPLPLMSVLTDGDLFASTERPAPVLEVLMCRYYKIRQLDDLRTERSGDFDIVRAEYVHHDRTVAVMSARARVGEVDSAFDALATAGAFVAFPDTAVIDLYLSLGRDDRPTADELSVRVRERLDAVELPGSIRRVAVIASHPDPAVSVQQLTFRRAGDEGVQPYWMSADDASAGRTDRFAEDIKFRGLHPMIARRLQMWRLSNFDIARLPSIDDVYAFDCVARNNPADRRLVAVAEVRDITPVRDESGSAVAMPGVEHVLIGCLDAIRHARAERPELRRLEWNRVMLYIWPVVELPLAELTGIARRLAPLTEGLGLEQVVVSGRMLLEGSSEPIDAVMRLGYEPGHGLTVRLTAPPTEPMQPLDDFTRKRIQTRRRGLVYAYELAPMLAGLGGTFAEYDLDETGTLGPVDRSPGGNSAGVVVGVVSSPVSGGHGRTDSAITRVAILGDATKAMGSITEAECRRILAAVDLADSMDVPVEWFALSAGAKIAMDSGSENLDWVARVLRRLVEHTQRGGEVNVVVAGINVGAQPYWNAEATMLMHTRGILVMTPDSAMVLTGKQAIDYSGGVSAEDNLGIGGYGRIMGPNGEAQYFVPTLAAACELLRDHYRLTYRTPGTTWPQRVATSDPSDRDVRTSPHRADGSEFTTVGDIFSDATNRDRKKPFAIRAVIGAVIDADHEPMERWPEMAEAEMAVVYDARLGGNAVTVIGIESRPLPRHGVTPADGPAQWSAGTLFPLSSKKVARAVNAASGCRPVVMLANLSGFDGSPESLRRLQLEYGAEIGRALVNFDGPFVLCVVSRYHGGAFVVFSSTLNDDMEVLAVEGSFASVIGGAPAAAVVFTRDVDERTDADERVQALEAAVGGARSDDEATVRRAELAEMRDLVRTEKLGEVASEFDNVHSVERAKRVGSVHRIITAEALRPELIAAVERGMERVEARRT